MPVTKRTRYEVLKRDNHTCRYCGATAPDAVLTIDHVTPVALGGTDAPDNLVAACRDCNYGKSSTSPTDTVVAQVSEEALRWGEAIKAAAAKMLDEHQSIQDRHEWFLISWGAWDEGHNYLPSGWAQSLDCWLGAGLPKEILLDCLEIALDNTNVAHRGVFAYMGGVAKKRIEALHDEARQLIEQGEQPHGA